MTSDTELHTAICSALKQRNVDVELLDAGGGILVTAAVSQRSDAGEMIRYFGVTLEDVWIVCEYREDSEEPRYFDGVEMDTSDVPAGDVDAVAAFVAKLVAPETCACGMWPRSEYGERCPSCPPADYRIVMWDWREQCPIPELEQATTAGYVWLTEVEDTGSDQHVVIATKEMIDQAAAFRAYQHSVEELQA